MKTKKLISLIAGTLFVLLAVFLIIISSLEPRETKNVFSKSKIENSELNVSIWATKEIGTHFVSNKEIRDIEESFESTINNPELINYQIITNQNKKEFMSSSKDFNYDVIISSKYMGEKFYSEKFYKNMLVNDEWISTSDSYLHIRKDIEEEKLETAKLFVDMLLESKKTNSKSKVLFVGNSYTFNNDLNYMFEDVCEDRYHEVDADKITHNGATLSNYANTLGKYHNELVKKLESKTYEVVILQEQSDRPLKNFNAFRNAVEKLQKLIKKYSSETKIILYSTWAKADGDSHYEKNNTTYGDETLDIANAYRTVGEELDIGVAYVGLHLYNLYKQYPEYTLYQDDLSHPAPKATYLASLVLAKAAFDVSLSYSYYTPSYDIIEGGENRIMPTSDEVKKIRTTVNNFDPYSMLNK